MYIRHSAELFYAAHILKVNRLDTLMIEIDRHLLQGKSDDTLHNVTIKYWSVHFENTDYFNLTQIYILILDAKVTNKLSQDDHVQWYESEKKIHQVRFKYNKLKMESFEHTTHKDISYDNNRINSNVDEQMKWQSTNLARDKQDNHQEDNVDISNNHDELKNLDQVLIRSSVFFCLGLLPPMRPFLITDRYMTAAITGIQTMEILKILEEILIDINESSDSGVFIEIFKRILIVLFIGQYSLRFSDLDQGHQSYESFLLWEILYTHPIGLDLECREPIAQEESDEDEQVSLQNMAEVAPPSENMDETGRMDLNSVLMRPPMQLNDVIIPYLFRVLYIPNTFAIIKQFYQQLGTCFHQRDMTLSSYLNIYRARKEFNLMKSIQHRCKKGKYIVRIIDKNGILHTDRATDYEKKTEVYRQKIIAYIELESVPLWQVINKVVHLLNDLRSKKKTHPILAT
ncbi:unnamed protein product [Rotaria sordida]|uniref:Uncharacterized protein n=1 Tax=Rotaria sordida TaxID=392033 RepID=A0A819BUV5_9BILA|nr:unnamed protein product [Rotaria sordida]